MPPSVYASVFFGLQKHWANATDALSSAFPKLKTLPDRRKERHPKRKGPRKVRQGEIEALARVPGALSSGCDETELASPP